MQSITVPRLWILTGILGVAALAVLAQDPANPITGVTTTDFVTNAGWGVKYGLTNMFDMLGNLILLILSAIGMKAGANWALGKLSTVFEGFGRA